MFRQMDVAPMLRADGHGSTPEYREEILDNARKRIHGLLDDAFALVATRPPRCDVRRHWQLVFHPAVCLFC